jgi:hypothetical protein
VWFLEWAERVPWATRYVAQAEVVAVPAGDLQVMPVLMWQSLVLWPMRVQRVQQEPVRDPAGWRVQLRFL